MGWTVCLSNRLAIGSWVVLVGTASTTNPIENLNDPHHWNQAWITANGSGVVRLKCVLGNALLSNPDWDISCMGCVNHNADGGTIGLRYANPDSGSTDNYSTATTFASSFTLDATSGNPNFLVQGSAAGAQGWYYEFSGLGSGYVLKLGNLIAGPAVDLGYPVRGDQVNYIPTVQSVTTEAGFRIHGRVQDPMIVKSVRFEDPTYMTKTTVWDKTATTNGAEYTTVQRAFEVGLSRSHAGSSTAFAGIAGAGGSMPLLYHEGANYDTGTTAGRPAFYGTWDVAIERNRFRNISAVNATITDLLPTGSSVKPATN